MKKGISMLKGGTSNYKKYYTITKNTIQTDISDFQSQLQNMLVDERHINTKEIYENFKSQYKTQDPMVGSKMKYLVIYYRTMRRTNVSYITVMKFTYLHNQKFNVDITTIRSESSNHCLGPWCQYLILNDDLSTFSFGSFFRSSVILDSTVNLIAENYAPIYFHVNDFPLAVSVDLNRFLKSFGVSNSANSGHIGKYRIRSRSKSRRV